MTLTPEEFKKAVDSYEDNLTINVLFTPEIMTEFIEILRYRWTKFAMSSGNVDYDFLIDYNDNYMQDHIECKEIIIYKSLDCFYDAIKNGQTKQNSNDFIHIIKNIEKESTTFVIKSRNSSTGKMLLHLLKFLFPDKIIRDAMGFDVFVVD